MEEIWKEVKGYEGLYEISSIGNIRSLDKYVNSGIKNNPKRFIKGCVLKTFSDKDGYLYTGLTKDRKKRMLRIHRLVCDAFHDNPENKPQVNHIDGIKDNNFYQNLEWSTLSENRQHAYDTGLQNGLSRRGRKCNFTKLSKDTVISIRSEYKKGKIKQKDLAAKYGVSQSAISSILKRKNWAYL